jgi:hypothetical protein
MKIKIFFAVLFPLSIFGQRNPYTVECIVKSFKTVCLEDSKKTIAEIVFPKPVNRYDIISPVKIRGRFEDLRRLSLMSIFKQNTTDFGCNENIKYDNTTRYEYYPQAKNDDRKLYFLEYDWGSYQGTVSVKKFNPPAIALDYLKKYVLFYNKEKEKDKNYEATYSLNNTDGYKAYEFHQQGDRFDEYTYEYTYFSGDYRISSVYKNEILFEAHSFYENEDYSFTEVITQYNLKDSYKLDAKDNTVLTTSQFGEPDTVCRCKEGYSTTIEIWNENKCRREKDIND